MYPDIFNVLFVVGVNSEHNALPFNDLTFVGLVVILEGLIIGEASATVFLELDPS